MLKNYSIPSIILLFCFTSCTEPFVIETVFFENLLVVESSITNEFKTQTVKLTRTTELENFYLAFENDALVSVEDDLGNNFHFSQDEETGIYLSNQKFQAFPNVKYLLHITTQNGKEYSSNQILLPPPVEISNLYAERSEEVPAVQVYLDTYNNNSNSNYFRYEFEETYRMDVPYPTNWSWELTNYNSLKDLFEVVLTRKEPDISCFFNSSSTGIIQAATNNLSENNVVRLPIHFIWARTPALRDRYSILVKQYVQSQEAYSFYKTIKDLASSGSLLSESQPGYVNGNVVSLSNPDEKVLGFFEVSSVTTKRIYFNYKDFEFTKPEYFIPCENMTLQASTFLKTLLTTNDFEIYDYITGGSPIPRYVIFKKVCTGCDSPGASKIKPDFWED